MTNDRYIREVLIVVRLHAADTHPLRCRRQLEVVAFPLLELRPISHQTCEIGGQGKVRKDANRSRAQLRLRHRAFTLGLTSDVRYRPEAMGWTPPHHGTHRVPD